MTSQPCLGSIVEALRHSPRDPGLDPEAHSPARASTGRPCARNTPPSKAISRPARRKSICTKCRAASSPTCASRRASLGLETRWHEVAKAYRAANDLFGDIVKVTPSSKVVGDMALMMVSQRSDAEPTCSIPTREIAFPTSVVEMLAGDLGQPPGGWPEGAAGEGAERRKADRRRAPARCCRRPISTPRAPPRRPAGASSTSDDLASYLMYPKVFTEYSATAAPLRPGLGAADAGVLLRHAAQ